MWDRPLGAGGASESSGKAPKPPRLPAPLPAQETSTPGSKVVPKSLFQSARKELLPPKGTSAKAEAPPTKAQVSGDKKPKKKAKTGSSASSKKQKIAPDSSETVVKEEKVESAGPGVQEHQESGEDSPAAPVGQEEMEEVGRALKDEEMPACKQEDNKEAAPEVGAPVPHVKEEPLPNE